MTDTLCGLDCTGCAFACGCRGCAQTDGRPFGGDCVTAQLLCTGGKAALAAVEAQLIAAVQALGLSDMAPLTQLHPLPGHYINLPYALPNGRTVQLLQDTRVYLGNQLHKLGSERCYGVAADEHWLLVCEYGCNGAEPALIALRRWN